MPLVPAVTELIVSELLYLQYTDRVKPVYIYLNSTGTTRADGETVGFETEGTAIYDTMCYLKNPVCLSLYLCIVRLALTSTAHYGTH
jgi:ATP-dependent protease ClpP protease subunit